MRGLWRLPLIGPLTFAAWKIDARRKYKWMYEHLPASGPLIDIGSGPGSLLDVMRRDGRAVDGLDITDSAYRTDLTAHLYDGGVMPFKGKTYTAALLSTMLHHTPDPDHILRESTRIAHRLIIIEDVYKGRVMEWLTKRFDSLMNLEFIGHPHTNRTDTAWRETFSNMGLTLISAEIYPVAGIFRQAVYVLDTPKA
ncbi:MAG: methyltransferase domain-containing protein [Maricaulaceae bacterium]